MANYKNLIIYAFDEAGKKRWVTISNRVGVKNVEMMRRLLDWFLQQDDYIQALVLGTLTKESMLALAKRRVAELEGKGGRKG